MVGMTEKAAMTRGPSLVFAGAAGNLGSGDFEDPLERLGVRQALEVSGSPGDDVVNNEETPPASVRSARSVTDDRP